jgi:hypothetical protein
VPVATRAEDLRVDAAAIIAHEDSQVTGRTLDFDFDLASPGVAESVYRSFAADPVYFLADRRA